MGGVEPKAANESRQAMLFLHGWGCDHTFLQAQAEWFGGAYDILVPDLPGHGSSRDQANLAVPDMSDAVVELCRRHRLQSPFIVGHSMGGMVALDIAHRYPTLPKALILIDSAIFPSPAIKTAIRQLAEGMRGPNPEATLDGVADALFHPTDDPSLKARYRQQLADTPLSQLRASFEAHLVDYDPSAAATSCSLPIAYIATETPLGDLVEIAARFRNVRIGQVLGCGHFAPMLAPLQVNAMIGDFVDFVARTTRTSQMTA